MGANASSQRSKRRGSHIGLHHSTYYHYQTSSRPHSGGTGGGPTTGGGGSTHDRAPSNQQQPPHYKSQHQQQQGSYPHQDQSRYTSVGTLNTMASVSSSQRRNAKSASTRTLLDRKCVFLGRYFARQFSQPVLQRLRYHVQHAKGTKTRIRLSTKGLTVGSKNTNVFKSQKSPYEFLPLDDIEEIFVHNDLRSVLLVIKGLPDGHLELLTYKLADELEARLYQQTFNEMVSMNGNRAGHQHYLKIMETSAVDGTLRSSGGTQLRAGGPGYGNHYTTTTLQSGSYNRRAGNSWSRTPPGHEGYVYRIKTNEYGSAPGTPSSRRGKPRHRSEGDALDVELRRQAEDRQFMEQMRRRDLNDNVQGDLDDVDGPIRLVFSKDGIIEQHGAASIIRGDGEDSFIGSDHDSGIQSKDNGNPDIVDAGMGTVRAHVSGYTATRSGSSSSRVIQDSTSFDVTDDTGYHGNGFVTSGRVSRSPTRATSSMTGDHVTHHVYADRSRAKRSESPAPSHQSRAQSEGGWRARMPWKRRSRSSDSTGGHHNWETTSLMVGSHARPAGRMYFPRKDGEKPPEYIVMYPSLNKNHRTKSKSASRFEL